jgi:bifunctional N-acetylglucosamine-1-phosphate-uridyltransferase/glucosamine-1-phosphate-acetyltransferase GlmU-like protein
METVDFVKIFRNLAPLSRSSVLDTTILLLVTNSNGSDNVLVLTDKLLCTSRRQGKVRSVERKKHKRSAGVNQRSELEINL